MLAQHMSVNTFGIPSAAPRQFDQKLMIFFFLHPIHHFSFIHKLIIQRHTVFIRYHIHGIFYEKIKTIIIHVKEMHVNVSKIHIKAHIAILPGVVSVGFCVFLLFLKQKKKSNSRISMIQLKSIQ